jgi:large subunit ribosomal protein L21
MFAVVRTGGKQYRVQPNDVIRVDRMDAEKGTKVALSDVLLMGSGADVSNGGKAVTAEILDHIRGDKVIVFKKTRRHTYRRRNGHRQNFTVLRITDVGGVGIASWEAKAEVSGAPVAAGALDASNLSLIAGVGPTIEKKLRAAGVQTWNDIAAWSEADVTKWNDELKLGGRATREEWVEQAKELLDGRPPRAKVDKAEAASGKDL